MLNANIGNNFIKFEFVQSQWVTDGDFIGHGAEQDPIIGNNEGEGIFTIPKYPIRRRLQGLPRFVALSGGGSTASCPA